MSAVLRAPPVGVRNLPFKCEIMICPAKEILALSGCRGDTDSPWRASKDPFSQQPSGSNIVRFVSVLAKPLRGRNRSDLNRTSNIKHQTSQLPPVPLSLPSDNDWLLKIIVIQGRFVLGVYRRQMKAISYLSRIEKRLGVPVTTRNWNTIEKVVTILRCA